MARTKEEAHGENGAAEAGRDKAAVDGGVKKPSARGRGRPRSENPKVKVSSGRPRGRPKGSMKKDAIISGAAGTKSRPKTAVAPGTPGGRGRGRPRKSDVEKTPKDSARKRGRPAKKAAGAEDEDQDQEDDTQAEEDLDVNDIDASVDAADAIQETPGGKSPDVEEDGAEDDIVEDEE